MIIFSMSNDVILDIKDLRLYYKFNEINSSTNYYYASASQAYEFKASDFFGSESQEDKILDQLEAINRKELLKSAKNYAELMKIVDGVNLSIKRKENMALVGESGCGKTTLLLSILNLPSNALKYIAGEIIYYPQAQPIDILKLPQEEMRELRGTHFSLIPQFPSSSINPWLKLGLQTGEILSERLSEKKKVVREKVIEILGKTMIPEPKIKIDKFLHQLSGGEAQKLCIAMALIANPKIVLADEIFTSLDAISQGQLIELLSELQDRFDYQYFFSTHNLTAALSLSKDIAVMYAGEIVEVTTTPKLMEEPLHPYTQGLLNSLPWYAVRRGKDLEPIEGESPLPYVWPRGCRFSPRCPKAIAKCSEEKPILQDFNGRKVSCWLYST